MPDTSIERGQAALDALATAETIQDAVKRLALLDCLEYEKLRDTEAQRLGVRVGVLDKEVSKARHTAMDEGGKRAIFPAVEPWPEPLDGAALLNELLATLQRYIVCARDTAVAVSLWCAFTWLIDRVQVAPLAVITAPEKRCGKTQLLNFIGKVCRRPLVASNISPAAVFRVIEAHNPTLLIDEADSFLKENEELRGVINSGHTRQSAYVIRTVGDEHEPHQFSTWGAKAISGIGHLAETIVDRAIVLELRRKLPMESVQRLRHAEPQLFERLASKLARFADDAGTSIERVVAKVAPLEPAFAQIAPLGEGDWQVALGAHRQGVAVDEVLRKHVERGAIQVVRRNEVQILGEDRQQVRAALGDVVRQQFDAVEAHQREQRVVPPLEIGLTVFEFHGGQLAPQDLHEEVAVPACRFQEPGVNALGLALDEVEHRLDHPGGGEYLPVVGDTLF